MSELSIEDFAAQVAQADQPEQPSQDSDPVEQQASEEGQATDAPEGEQPEGEQSEQPEGDSEQIIEWQTANGEAFKVPVKELQNGYLRQQDYTRKAQEVAQERVQAQTEIRQQVQIVSALAEHLGEVRAIGKQLERYQQVDWETLKQADPTAYFDHRDKFRDLKEAAVSAEQRARQARAQYDGIQGQTIAQGIAQAEAHLSQKVSGVNRDEVLRTFSALQKSGADQRVIDIVRSTPALAEFAVYANRWLELQEKKPQVENRVKSLPPVTSKARPASAPSSRLEEVSKTVQAKRSFTVNDFASLLKATR